MKSAASKLHPSITSDFLIYTYFYRIASLISLLVFGDNDSARVMSSIISPLTVPVPVEDGEVFEMF